MKRLAPLFLLALLAPAVARAASPRSWAPRALLASAAAGGGGGACATCADNLRQAYILDDGAGTLEDYVSTHTLTLVNGAVFAGSNNGVTFDGTNDVAQSTPVYSDWQQGITVAVLSTIPNAADDVLFFMQDSANTENRIRIGSNASGPFTRLQAYMGREFNDGEFFVDGCEPGDATKKWRFIEYDPAGTDGTGAIYENSASVTCDTDVDVEEFGDTIGMNRLSLGAVWDATNPAATTIYRVLIWSRLLTQTEKQAVLDGWTPTND